MEEVAAGSLVFPGSALVQTPSTVQQQAVAQYRKLVLTQKPVSMTKSCIELFFFNDFFF